MWIRTFTVIGFVVLFSFHTSSWAIETLKREEAMKLFLAAYEQGDYAQALKSLNQTSGEDSKHVQVQYWRGITQIKSQRYDLAIKPLTDVVNKDSDLAFKDASYQLGQSYYAVQKFKEALPCFEASSKLGYQKSQSLYYKGYIQSILKEYTEALKTFDEALGLPSSESEMKLPTQFQIGEVHFQIGSKMPADQEEDKTTQKLYFSRTVVPAYEKVIEMDTEAPLATQARGRIYEIQQKFKMDVPKTAGDVTKPIHAWVIRLSEDIKFDSNVVNEADGKIVKVLNSSDVYSKTSFLTKIEGTFFNRLVLTPELTADITYYGRRNNPSLFTNDNANLTPVIRSRLDHKVWDRSASGLGEYEFNYNWKDYKSNHRLPFYSRSHNFILGERFEPFKIGQSTIKLSLKLSINQNDSLTYYAPKLSLSQGIKLGTHLITVSGYAEKQRANAALNDQKSYNLTASMSLPNLFWKISADPTMSMTFLDTMNQDGARGTEKTLAPGVTFNRALDRFGDCMLNLNYTYTRNFSKDLLTYDYKKHVVGLGVSYSF